MTAYSQQSINLTTIKGVVRDSLSKKPVPYTAIFLKDKIRPEMILGLIVIVLGILIQLKKDKKE